MGIVVALDVHRNQITYKALDRDTGELRPAGRIRAGGAIGAAACCGWDSSPG